MWTPLYQLQENTLCEFVKEKSQLSMWESFVSCLKKEARICESKLQWMVIRKSGGYQTLSEVVYARFVITQCLRCLQKQQEKMNSSCAENATAKCPVHKSTKDKLQSF